MRNVPISSLVPHQGTMCLLERVIEWDDRRVVLETATHRSPSNPLRSNGRLRSLALCEYGAQAMAVHGGLRGTVTGVKPKPGMLVLFPSYFWHGTVPFEDGGRRLTAAFDVVPG